MYVLTEAAFQRELAARLECREWSRDWSTSQEAANVSGWADGIQA